MPPILVAHLFPELGGRLVDLLRSLTPADWHRPTSSSRRAVRDVAAHLLDGSLRRLSLGRDAYSPPDGSARPRPGEPLLAFLTRLNDEWETGTRRLSPRVLTDLVEWADRGLADLFASLDPHGPALFPVAWAGDEASANWMDVARDYTEKWHHARQIFDATGRPSTITGRRLMHPCLDAFMRALPVAFRGVEAAPGTAVVVVVTGEAGGSWLVERGDGGWRQVPGASVPPTSTVTMDADTAWRLVTKRRTPDEARRLFPDIRVEGDERLGMPVLGMVSMMA
ncbi:MAG TPA: maleylpyruvate isomerase N-terminal domain-containing protein [Urbifossiella sp.]|nr:maleylpyruvate isomerase N-terminal domain-containing protein [Urbifossiella sp.]